MKEKTDDIELPDLKQNIKVTNIHDYEKGYDKGFRDCEKQFKKIIDDIIKKTANAVLDILDEEIEKILKR